MRERRTVCQLQQILWGFVLKILKIRIQIEELNKHCNNCDCCDSRHDPVTEKGKLFCIVVVWRSTCSGWQLINFLASSAARRKHPCTQNLRGGVQSGPSPFSVDKVQTIVFNTLTTPLSKADRVGSVNKKKKKLFLESRSVRFTPHQHILGWKWWRVMENMAS